MGIHSSLISLHRIHNCSIMLYHYTTHLKLFPFFHNSFQNQLPRQSKGTWKVPGWGVGVGGLWHKRTIWRQTNLHNIHLLLSLSTPPCPPSLLKVGALESWKEGSSIPTHPPQHLCSWSSDRDSGEVMKTIGKEKLSL